MKHKILNLFFSLALMLLLGSGEPVLACWCRSVTNCEAVNRASTVFVGKVKSVKSNEKLENGEVSFSPKETILFQIKDNFFGTHDKEIKVETGGGSDCDYFPFQRDETYLVYAFENEEKKLEVGLCGRTKPVNKAAEDLKYLRNLSQGTQNGKILGSVHGVVFDSVLNRYDGRFLPQIPLLLEGDGINKTILTDAWGDFEINKLKAGKYTLQVFLPNYYSLAQYGKDESVNEIILNGRGCSEIFFHAEVKNSIEGSVFDINGKPLKNIEVYLIPETKIDEEDTDNIYSTDTAQNGKYKFDFVFPRSYRLGIKTNQDEENEPDLFYPNTQNASEAVIIKFELGQNLKGFDLIWQDSQK